MSRILLLRYTSTPNASTPSKCSVDMSACLVLCQGHLKRTVFRGQKRQSRKPGEHDLLSLKLAARALREQTVIIRVICINVTVLTCMLEIERWHCLLPWLSSSARGPVADVSVVVSFVRRVMGHVYCFKTPVIISLSLPTSTARLVSSTHRAKPWIGSSKCNCGDCCSLWYRFHAMLLLELPRVPKTPYSTVAHDQQFVICLVSSIYFHSLVSETCWSLCLLRTFAVARSKSSWVT